MNSSGIEPGVESELVDLEAVTFTTLREMDSEPIRHSQRHVVERTRHVHARYPSSNTGAGERID
jgi:hypothetical protein